MAYRIRTLRLSCTTLHVETRYVQLRRGRWIASADTPDGPTLGYGPTGFAAMWMALQPFENVIEELLASVPAEALSSPD